MTQMIVINICGTTEKQTFKGMELIAEYSSPM
jgi:hypothetical protein